MGQISEAWQAWLATQEGLPQPRTNIHASSLDDLCYRRVVYGTACPEKAASTPASLHSVFWMGRALQQAWAPVLNSLGYEIVEQMSERVWPSHHLSGSVDYRVKCPDGERRILEFKTISHTFHKVTEATDFLKLAMPYHAWYGQVQTYCVLYNVEECILVILEKSSGQIKDWLVPLDYSYADVLMDKAEKVPMWVERWGKDKDDLPPRLEGVAARECDRCRFMSVCLPDWKSESGELVEDEGFVDALERQEELKAVVKEREDTLDFIKLVVGERERVLAPGWIVERKLVTPEPKPRVPQPYMKINIRRTQ